MARLLRRSDVLQRRPCATLKRNLRVEILEPRLVLNSTAPVEPSLAMIPLALHRRIAMVSWGFTSPAPTVAAAAAASNLTTTTVQLSTLGADANEAHILVYTWTVAPPAGAPAPTFSSNGTSAAHNTTVTFARAGTYTFTATITDRSDGLSVSGGRVTVTVAQALSGLSVTPGSVTVSTGGSQQFTAAGVDQFGQSEAISAATWSITGSGAVNATSGLYTAPAQQASATVTAQAGGFSAHATVTVSTGGFLTLKDPALASLTKSLDADGSIGRSDMIAILRSVETENGGVLSATDFSDLKTILADAATLDMPGYVQVLAADVIAGNVANAHYQGAALGNLAVGSSAAQLNELIDKWFLGTDTPATGGYAYATLGAAACGELFTAGSPSTNDEKQGLLGDCYLISSLGAVANSAPAAISNMIIDNGVDAQTGIHSWTVRFYDNGVADYVTVDNQLPVSGSTLVFDGYGSSISSPKGLWIALIEKAYAQWNETGKEGRDGQNSYASIEGGWMADVDAQVLGQNAASYDLSSTSDQQALVAGMTAKMAVTIGTDNSNNSNDTLPYGLYGDHAYAIIGYNSAAGTFTLYNPWGVDQPTQALTWAQLQTVTDGFVVANASQTQPIAGSTLGAAVGPVLAPQLAGSVLSSAQPAADAATANSRGSSQRTAVVDAALANWTTLARRQCPAIPVARRIPCDRSGGPEPRPSCAAARFRDRRDGGRPGSGRIAGVGRAPPILRGHGRLDQPAVRVMAMGALDLVLDDPFHPATLQADTLLLAVGAGVRGDRRWDQSRLMDHHAVAVVLVDHQHAADPHAGRLRPGQGEYVVRYQPLGQSGSDTAFRSSWSFSPFSLSRGSIRGP